MLRRLFSMGALVVGLTLSTSAEASTSTDIQGMVTQLQTLDDEFLVVATTPPEACLSLGTLSTSVQDYTAVAEQVTAALSSPTQPTADDLDNLVQLSVLTSDISSKVQQYSAQMQTVEGVYDLFEYRSAMAAMLQLSADIGTMADRILEMANRILAMADNIGVMADRILATQRLHNANIAATQAAMLTTQQNMIALADSVNTIAYNVTLGQVKTDSLALRDAMDVPLTSTNMADQLTVLQGTSVESMNRMIALYSQVTEASQQSSHYINGDTLALIDETTAMHAALAVALESYAQAIETLAPVTDTVILRDATQAMLQLVRDIGAMSDRILEMKDKILVMADNIGLMAGRIVETQDIQRENILLTQSSLASAQRTTVSIIQTWGL